MASVGGVAPMRWRGHVEARRMRISSMQSIEIHAEILQRIAKHMP